MNKKASQIAQHTKPSGWAATAAGESSYTAGDLSVPTFTHLTHFKPKTPNAL